jgi:hypothetical protein
MPEPWAGSTYIVPKDPAYDRWHRRWVRLTGELDALEAETRRTGECDAVLAAVLIENVKHAELIREGAAMAERWHMDADTLLRLSAVPEWTIKTISEWLGLDNRQRNKIKLKEVRVPPDVVVRVVVPLVLPHIESRRHRAWVLTVAEIISSLG